jgi:preprotein translocase subunit SecA
VLAAGGLHIVGTERHESRRIDNQLRGRSGRQGDPGSSRFYLSMEDNLMRIFGDPNRTKRLLAFAGMKEGEVIESRMLTSQIEKAQRKVEGHNFDIRKQLLTFDDVANDQRKVIYQQRTELMGAENLADAVRGIRAEVVNGMLDEYLPSNVSHEEWNLEGLAQAIAKNFATQVDPRQWLKDQPDLEEPALRGRVIGAIDAMYDAKVQRIGEPIMRHVEKDIMLKVLDQQWREHLGAMDYLRQGIHLRGYAQKDYRYEYKREAFELFAAMLERIKSDTVTILATLDVQVKSPEQIEREEEQRRERLNRALQLQHAEAASLSQLGAAGEVGAPQGAPSGARQPQGQAPMPQSAQMQRPVRAQPKVGRNQPCPCGSGKKFKNCHGVLEGVE